VRRGVFFIGIGVVSWSGCAAPPREAREPDPGAFHFVIESYNINGDMWGNQATLAAIGSGDADIVCLQELTDGWQTAIESRYASRYPYRMFKATPNASAAGLGIISRFPLQDGGWHEGPSGWHPAWHYLVQTPHGVFKVLNAHLRNATGEHGGTVQSYLTTPDDHRYEIQLFVAENSATLPTVILGDFNEGPDGAAVQYLQGVGFQNALPLFHPGQPTWRYGRSVGGQLTQEDDHILFDDSFEPLNAWVVNGGASDHLPVLAHFEAKGSW